MGTRRSDRNRGPEGDPPGVEPMSLIPREARERRDDRDRERSKSLHLKKEHVRKELVKKEHVKKEPAKFERTTTIVVEVNVVKKEEGMIVGKGSDIRTAVPTLK